MIIFHWICLLWAGPGQGLGLASGLRFGSRLEVAGLEKVRAALISWDCLVGILMGTEENVDLVPPKPDFSRVSGH